MTTNRFRVELLGSHHDRAAFSCGVSELDDYLHTRAGQDTRRHLAAVFVLQDLADGLVAGYYTLSADSVDPSGLPQAIAKRLPRRPVPVILLGRLAVDDRYREQRFGEFLLIDALHRALLHSREIAAMAVIVDAKEGARSFYEHYKFQRFLDNEYRLFIPMGDVEDLTAGIRQ